MTNATRLSGRLLTVLALLQGVVTSEALHAQEAVDLVLVNGRIFTADPLRPWAEAVAIDDGRIVTVGSTEAIRPMGRRATRVVDLAGRVVIPGFNDAHWHVWPTEPAAYIAMDDRDPSLQTVADSVASVAARVPPGTWIIASVGPDILDDPVAVQRSLERVAPDHPVRLGGWPGHSGVLNRAGLRAAGIPERTPDPAGGWYDRDAEGDIVAAHGYAWFGIAFRGNAALPDSVVAQTITSDAAKAAAFGITTIQDMSLPVDADRAMRIARPLDLPVRIRIMRAPPTLDANPQLPRDTRASDRLYASGVKWIADGTPIERLAARSTPYADRAGWLGRAYMSGDAIRAAARAAWAAGTQPMFHAVGDATIDTVFAALRSVAPDSAWRRLRPRLEHADFLRPDQLGDARRLGIVVVQNPAHLMVPDQIAARAGARMAETQLLATVLRAGVPLALGSDGPTNPFLNLMFATLHPGRPDEALTREQAVIAMTYGSAYAEGADDKGMIAEGMLADLAVLSQDIFEVPSEALPGTTAIMTIVGGRVVHEAE